MYQKGTITIVDKELNNNSILLYYMGDKDLLKCDKLVAMVGSRRMSEYGKSVIEKLVPQMVKKGMVIVSGMAFGVDAWVQNTCVENGGKTIAVLASGPDKPTPMSNAWLYEKILRSGGLVVSTKDFGKEVGSKYDFLERNRIVAMISKAVVVVEGGERSGSVNTARTAVEMGIEVGAIPGGYLMKIVGLQIG
jgi:DNA processing protein